ncbi:MAG: acetate kinase, partial [Bacilli bacterium]|nr:acetate kinase [Bacilli bacterium]
KIKKEAELNNHTAAVNILIEELIENKVIENLDEIKAVGHRLVHGGDKYSKSIVIDNDVIDAVEQLSSLAPLHNPANLMGVKAFMDRVPNALQVACFDTAFHQTMENVNYIYPVPYEWYENYSVRKYGFHGMSHRYVSERCAEILDKKDSKIIVCHLGNGGSLSAVKNGKCINTTMGLSPNAGIMMGSRSGDIDSSMILYIHKNTGMSIEEIDNALNKKSGFLGVTGISSDSRDIEDGIKEGNERCILAQNMYVRRVINYIAQYYVELEGADAICFTAGIGENSASTRKQILNGLKALGIEIDEEANNVRGKETLITTTNSKVPCYIIPTDEEVMIARDSYTLLNEKA